jgi:hypothetical protein
MARRDDRAYTAEAVRRAVSSGVHQSDYDATLLHLFGLDHETLEFTQDGRNLTLVDKQPCRVIKEILA